MPAGRPSSGQYKDGITYVTFAIWDINKEKLKEVKQGYKTEEINKALQQYFRFKGKLEQDIIFEIEEHNKIIERHQGIINTLEEELGKQQKEKAELLTKEASKEQERTQKINATLKKTFNPEHFIGKKIDGILITKDMVDKIKGEQK